MQDVVKLGSIEYRIAITPDGNRTTWRNDALRFAKKRRGVKPMKRLCRSNEID
jgi:hypothetical protein